MIIACDPGLKGAFAWMNPSALVAVSLPLAARTVSRREKTVLDEDAVCLLFGVLGRAERHTLVIEAVNGAPGQSAAAAFTFGHGVGVIETVARCGGMKVVRVPPQTWKGALHVPSDKRLSRARASELMPQWAHLWPLQKDEGKAEAAMIWLWAKEHVK